MSCDDLLALHNDDSVFRARYHREEEKESKGQESGGEGRGTRKIRSEQKEEMWVRLIKVGQGKVRQGRARQGTAVVFYLYFIDDELLHGNRLYRVLPCRTLGRKHY